VKKRFIQILIILITTAFVGLIAIQIYWINNSILLRQQEFDYNVNRAMTSVVKELEKRDYYRQISKEESGGLSISRGNSDSDKGIVLNFYDEEGEGEKSEPPEKQSQPVPIEDFRRQMLTEIEPSPQENDLFELESKDRDSILYSEWGEYGLEQAEILEQSGFIEDILSGAMTLDIYQGIDDRVDPEELDSLLNTELVNHGINASYELAVFNRYDQPEIIEIEDEGLQQSLLTEGYRHVLFPNDPVRDPYFLQVYFPHRQRYLLQTMSMMLSISAVLILVIMFAFSYAISTIYRQKHLSEIKNDFINNMTHELKTPISTISLACEALSDPDMMKTDVQMKNFVGMINEENKRLGMLVENVLRSAILDKGDMELKLVRINIHELIKDVIRNIAIQVKKKGGSIKTDLSAINPIITADKVHITNLIYNLIDNAIKYSFEEPLVRIISEDREDGVVISFADNGMGISKENQKKIFDRLFRVPTGNVHDVKGFGLGLSYVQAVVEKHSGNIEVESELNKGSIFKIFLPAEHEKEN
jgi:two-component system phosphate regulon sensor histidine kinase PhoR